MIILPKLRSPYATEHPTLIDNALKILIAIWNATLETMILQFSLTLPQFLSTKSTVVHSFAINDLDQSQKSKHNILLEQFGARKASLDRAYFNFRDNGITALLQFNLAISFLQSMFKPSGVAIAAFMVVIFLGNALYFGSVIGSMITAIAFYAIIWGKSKEKSILVEKEVHSLAQSTQKPLFCIA
ncbi:hypothetical protein ACFX16_045207 [Malus domestica]